MHVVYKTAAENISDGQVKSQIVALNRDYGQKNADKSTIPAPWKGLAANPNIQFALAKKDPTGKQTTGITRTKTTRGSFGTGDSVKSKVGGGDPAWPADRYLNLWACTLGGGLLGFALIHNQHWLNFAAPARKTARLTRRRGGAFQKDWSRDMNR